MNKLTHTTSPSGRIAFGVNCSWWGAVENLGFNKKCLYCGGEVGEMDEKKYIDMFTARSLEVNDLDLVTFINWLRDRKCTPVTTRAGRVIQTPETKALRERFNVVIGEAKKKGIIQ